MPKRRACAGGATPGSNDSKKGRSKKGKKGGASPTASEPPPPYEPSEDGQFGFGPTQTQSKWITNCTKVEATNQVKRLSKEGAFIVRPSTESSSGNILTVLQRGKVKHFMIELGLSSDDAEEFYLEDGEDVARTASLDELIDRYTQAILEPLAVKLLVTKADASVRATGGGKKSDRLAVLQAQAQRDSFKTRTNSPAAAAADDGDGLDLDGLLDGERPGSMTGEDFLDGLDGLPKWKQDVIIKKREDLAEKEQEMQARELEIARREKLATERYAKMQRDRERANREIDEKRARAMAMAAESAKILQIQQAEQLAREQKQKEIEARAAAEAAERERLNSEREKRISALIYEDGVAGRPTHSATVGNFDEESDDDDDDAFTQSLPKGKKGKDGKAKGYGARRAGSVKRLAVAMKDELSLVQRPSSPDQNAPSQRSPERSRRPSSELGYNQLSPGSRMASTHNEPPLDRGVGGNVAVPGPTRDFLGELSQRLQGGSPSKDPRGKPDRDGRLQSRAASPVKNANASFVPPPPPPPPMPSMEQLNTPFQSPVPPPVPPGSGAPAPAMDRAAFLAKIGAQVDKPSPFGGGGFLGELSNGKASLQRGARGPEGGAAAAADAGDGGFLGELTNKLMNRTASNSDFASLEDRAMSPEAPMDPFQAELFSRINSRRNTEAADLDPDGTLETDTAGAIQVHIPQRNVRRVLGSCLGWVGFTTRAPRAGPCREAPRVVVYPPPFYCAREHTRTHTHTRARTHTHTHTHARARTHTHAHTHTHTHTHTHIHTHTHTRARTHALTVDGGGTRVHGHAGAAGQGAQPPERRRGLGRIRVWRPRRGAGAGDQAAGDPVAQGQERQAWLGCGRRLGTVGRHVRVRAAQGRQRTHRRRPGRGGGHLHAVGHWRQAHPEAGAALPRCCGYARSFEAGEMARRERKGGAGAAGKWQKAGLAARRRWQV